MGSNITSIRWNIYLRGLLITAFLVLLSLPLAQANMLDDTRINITELSRSASDKPVIVAVIDTGVDYTHEDLRGKFWVNEKELNGLDHVDDDNNGCVDDIHGCDFRSQVKEHFGYYPGLGGADYKTETSLYPDGIGHGTHVAGIIAAIRSNGVGIDGVSANARIMAINFILPSNSADMGDAAKAIRYAVDNGAHIINASFGRRNLSSNEMKALGQSLDYAERHGVLIVASAGNQGQDIDKESRFFPGGFRHSNLLTVAAVTPEGELWESSNFGSVSVDVAAKGVDVRSTVPAGSPSTFRKMYDPSGYKVSEGTSVATPYVTGIAAQVLAHNPSFTSSQIRGAILDLAETRHSLVGKTVRGGEISVIK